MYAYSISYFIMLVPQEGRYIYYINTVVFDLINLAIIAGAIMGFIYAGGSKCGGAAEGYGPVTIFLSVMGLIFVLFELAFSTYLYYGFQNNGKLPLFNSDKAGN